MKELQLFFCSAILLLLVNSIKSDFNEDDIRKCLDKDSISCIQMQLFRNARELMNQDSISLLAGMSLVRDKGLEGRSGKSLETLEMEEKVENATDVLTRQDAIENFLVRKARDIVVERTIRWDVEETIRRILDSIPQAIRDKFGNYVDEARSRGKRILRILLPLLIGLKLKMAVLSVLSFLGIGMLAKKALFASALSILISGFIGLKKLLAAKNMPHENLEMTQYEVPTYGPPHVYDNHADYAQKLAYNGHMHY